MTFAAIYSWASQREIFHFLLNTAVTGACRFSPSCQPQGVQHVRPVSLSVERQETGRAKEKQKLVGKAKHYSSPQWLHSYHQAHGQKVFSWHEDNFKSLRVYNLTASGLDSLSVYKYCPDIGRHFPLFLPVKGRQHCAIFPLLHLLVCTEVALLAKSHLHLRWQLILPDFDGEIVLGKLMLLWYKVLTGTISIIKHIHYQPKQMHSFMVFHQKPLHHRKKKFVLSL